jgi:hypothetical protein
MSTHIFVSYDHENAEDILSFRTLKSLVSPQLIFSDYALADKHAEAHGSLVKLLPDRPGSEEVEKKLHTYIEMSSRMLVLIGNNTHRNDWVDWQVDRFFREKLFAVGKESLHRILGMRLKECRNATVPKALLKRDLTVIDWSPDTCNLWMLGDIHVAK